MRKVLFGSPERPRPRPIRRQPQEIPAPALPDDDIQSLPHELEPMVINDPPLVNPENEGRRRNPRRTGRGN